MGDILSLHESHPPRRDDPEKTSPTEFPSQANTPNLKPWNHDKTYQTYMPVVGGAVMALYRALGTWANHATLLARPSLTSLRAITGYDRETIISYIRILEVAGLVQVNRVEGRVSVYTMIRLTDDQLTPKHAESVRQRLDQSEKADWLNSPTSRKKPTAHQSEKPDWTSRKKPTRTIRKNQDNNQEIDDDRTQGRTKVPPPPFFDSKILDWTRGFVLEFSMDENLTAAPFVALQGDLPAKEFIIHLDRAKTKLAAMCARPRGVDNKFLYFLHCLKSSLDGTLAPEPTKEQRDRRTTVLASPVRSNDGTYPCPKGVRASDWNPVLGKRRSDMTADDWKLT